MIVNVLRFRFKAEVQEWERQRAVAAISRTTSMESVSFSTVGQDLTPSDGYTHGYCVGIKDLEALDRYLSDPIHREGDFLFLPLLEKMTRTALSDDPDVDLGQKIGEMYLRKMQADPEWFALVRSALNVDVP